MKYQMIIGYQEQQTVDYMVVAGGGGGGSVTMHGGGGGAGGYRASGYGPSPLQGSAQELEFRNICSNSWSWWSWLHPWCKCGTRK